MNEKNVTPIEENSYQTGRTTPPKSHSGLIAVLLAVIILLGGMVSALGLLNIRLFRATLGNQPEKSAISFTRTAEAGTPASVSENGLPIIGFSGKDISSIDQLYYRIPAGIYITDITPSSPAQAHGIEPGDILLRFNGGKITSTAALANALSACKPGDVVTLVIYRDGEEFTVNIALGQSQ